MQNMDPLLDATDLEILARLRENAREPAASIAKHVNLTAGAVRRRIERLERQDVIGGYTVAINHDKVGPSVEAYVELSFEGHADVHAILRDAVSCSEVREAMTVAGDFDALVRIRAKNMAALREAVMDLRKRGPITSTKTRIVIGRWWHGAKRAGSGPPESRL